MLTYLGDTYEIYVSPFDFVKIFIIHLFIIILPRICSQDISRLNKAIVMKLSMMIDLSLINLELRDFVKSQNYRDVIQTPFCENQLMIISS